MRIRGVGSVTFAVLLATGCAAIPSLPTATDDAEAPDGSLADAPSNEAAADTSADVSVDVSIDAPADAACSLAQQTGNATCDACLAASCCDVANACLASSDCLAIVQCTRNCVADGGAAGQCRNQCRDLHPASKKAFNDLLTCIGGPCKNATCG